MIVRRATLLDDVEQLRDVMNGDLFFIGQNALNWSGRAPFFMVSTIPDGGSQRFPVSRQAPATVGEADLAGESTLERLGIRRFGDNDSLLEIARVIMEMGQGVEPSERSGGA